MIGSQACWTAVLLLCVEVLNIVCFPGRYFEQNLFYLQIVAEKGRSWNSLLKNLPVKWGFWLLGSFVFLHLTDSKMINNSLIWFNYCWKLCDFVYSPFKFSGMLAYFSLMFWIKFCFFCSICYFIFSNLKLFFHTSITQLTVCNCLDFLMFILTSEGKRFLLIREVIKSEKIINGCYLIYICQRPEEQDIICSGFCFALVSH